MKPYITILQDKADGFSGWWAKTRHHLKKKHSSFCVQFRVCKPTECSLWVEVACRIRTQNPAPAWGPEGSRQALRVWWELGQRHVRVTSMGGSSSSRPEDGTVGSASASIAESSCRQKSCAFAPDARDVLWSLEVSICRWFHCQTTFLVVWLFFLSAVHLCKRHLKPTAGDRLHSLLCCKVLFFRHSVSLVESAPGQTLNYSTWEARGWCRLEYMARCLAREDGGIITIKSPHHQMLGANLNGVLKAHSAGSSASVSGAEDGVWSRPT